MCDARSRALGIGSLLTRENQHSKQNDEPRFIADTLILSALLMYCVPSASHSVIQLQHRTQAETRQLGMPPPVDGARFVRRAAAVAAR